MHDNSKNKGCNVYKNQGNRHDQHFGRRRQLTMWIRDRFIAGLTAPPGRRMGHAGAIVSGGDDTAEAKMRILTENGIAVCESVADIGEKMKKALNT